MKYVIDSDIPYLVEELQSRYGSDIDIVLKRGSDISSADLRDADGLIVRTRTRVDAELLENSAVKVVATATAGTDHIDAAYCASHGIRVYSAPGCNAPAVAQYVASLVDTIPVKSVSPTIAIIGRGNIGGLLAPHYREAGWRVLVCDPPRAEAGLRDERYLPFETVLPEADVVTFHVPLTRDGNHPTFHILNAATLALLKPGATVINASRGGVIDETEALLTRPDISYIIDTWEMEEQPDGFSHVKTVKDYPFMQRALIATPHIAGYSIAGKRRASEMVLESLLSGRQAAAPEGEGVAQCPSEQFLDLSLRLKNAPYSFEALRSSYPLRP